MTQNGRQRSSNAAGFDADGQNAFDFFPGTWTGRNRKISNYLSETGDWVEFESITKSWMLWNGRGNMDETVSHEPGGDVTGSAIRVFDPVTKLWAIYFLSPGNLQISPPRMGRFLEGIGEFSGRDTYNGQQVMAKSRWERIDPGSPRWEQAISVDCGKTWKINWIIEFSKR
jgi:hypothetical protein